MYRQDRVWLQGERIVERCRSGTMPFRDGAVLRCVPLLSDGNFLAALEFELELVARLGFYGGQFMK